MNYNTSLMDSFNSIPNILRSENMEIFKSFINMIQAGVLLVDAKKKDMPIIFVNDAFVSMTGYSKKEVLGENPRFLQGELRNQKPKFNIKKALIEKTSCETELKNFTKEGIPFYNLLKITPLFDEQGDLLYYMGMQLDITNSIEYRKISTIKRLSEGLTHEINTAMAPIKGHMEMLQYDIEAMKDENTKEYMLDSLQSIQKSKKIIEEISTSLHYFSSVQRDDLQSVNIPKSLYECIDQYKEKLQLNSIALELQIEEALFLKSEKDALVHLWMILLDNSIDALLEVTTTKTIIISAKKITNNIQVIFEDNALGINPKIQEDIFKALTKSKEYGGKGIGLFVAKSIVESNNGEISFTTSAQGTKFTITLPLS